MLDITDESGGQCQHTRSTQAPLWLAGLCPEQSLTHGWVGMGSHSALVQVGVGKSTLKSYPAQCLRRLCSEQGAPPANLPSQATLPRISPPDDVWRSKQTYLPSQWVVGRAKLCTCLLRRDSCSCASPC